MNVLRRPAWWIPVIIVIMHQIGQYGLGLKLGWVDGYLDPLLCLPVLLGVWAAERQMLFRLPPPSGFEVIVAGLALALLFEEGFPKCQPAFVRDWWDYPAYAVGGLWFWWRINPRLESN